MTSAAASAPLVPIRLEMVQSLGAALGGDAGAELKMRIEQEIAALLSELGLAGTPGVEITSGPKTRPLRVVVHGFTVPYPMRLLLLSAQPDLASDPGLRSRSSNLIRSPAAWTALIKARLEAASPAEWAVSFVTWLTVNVIRLTPSCLVGDAQVAAYLGNRSEAADSERRAFVRQVLAGLLDLGVGLRSRDVVLSIMDVGVAAGASPTQITEQAFRRLRGYEVSLAAHPEYLSELLGSPVKETMAPGELPPDQALWQQFAYVGEAVREDLGLSPPRFRLVPDPSVAPGWLTVQLHDQRGWPVRGLRSNDLLVPESARRVSQHGLETRAMQNPYTGEEGAEVPATAGRVLDAAGLPYWTAAAFTAIVTHLALRRRVETLIGPAEVEILLAELALDHPDLVALTTRLFTITELTKVLRALVREGVPIRDLRTILEQLVLQEVGTVIDPDDDRRGDDGLASTQQLTRRIRRGLNSAISAQFAGRHRRLLALRADQEFQRRAVALLRSAEPSQEAQEQLLDELWEAVQQASRAGAHPVVITSDGARWAVRCLIDSEFPELPVLAESEIRNDIEVVLLPWTEARMTVDYLVVCDRVARFLTDSAGPSLRQDGPGTFSFSRGSATVTVEAAVRHDESTVITVSAWPPVEVAATPAILEWLATAPPERGVQILLERVEGAFRPVCSMVLLGDFLDPEELEFALATVTSVADEVQVDVERQGKVAVRGDKTSAHIDPPVAPQVTTSTHSRRADV
jgi:hypothetical protein